MMSVTTSPKSSSGASNTFGDVRQVDAGLRNVGYVDAGPADGPAALLLHGWPYGAPHPEPSAYAMKFSGEYSHRTIEGGIGHNLPQEAPAAFAAAVLEVGGGRK